MKKLHVHIAVAAPVAGPFTYEVPEPLQAAIAPGLRVLVPFGPRRVTGYVLESVPEPENMKILAILGVLDDSPLFPAELLPFFRKMADYYHYPLGETLASVLPAGLNRTEKTLYSLTEAGREALQKDFSEKEILLCLQNGPRTLESIRAQEKTASLSQMQRLVRASLVEKNKILAKEDIRPKTRKVYQVVPETSPPVSVTPKRLQLWDWIRKNGPASQQAMQVTLPHPGSALRWLVEKGLVSEGEERVFRDPLGEEVLPDKSPALTPEQERIWQELFPYLERGFHRFLLHGITGSGKTEIYLRLAEETLKRGKTAIILVPEIALISQVAGRFRARFGEKVAILHSGLSKGERLDQWEKILSGALPLVIGARSAVFAPLRNAGLIIVDEEHDFSYKQDTGLKYNGRDMAILRAQMEDCLVLLGSATPSIQSMQNVRDKKYKLLRLNQRVNRQPLPRVELVDLREMKTNYGIERYFSQTLFSAMKKCLEEGEQVLLFLNRRGYAGFPVCSVCGTVLKCPHCDISLTLHRGVNALLCHFCGFSMAPTTICPACRAPEMRVLGMGTEKVEAAARYLFPEARILRMDQDSTSGKGTLVQMLKQIRKREVDILVGTQMVTKGHDFPGITLVGILNADLGLSFPDFRSCERNFQLLAQVAGRAGRGEKPGRVILQTYNPDHYSIQTASAQDSEAFFEKEIETRKILGYPPFSRMIQIRISGKEEAKVREAARLSAEKARAEAMGKIRILGPVESPISRMAGYFRYQILLLGTHGGLLNRAADAATNLRIHGVTIVMDVDPYAML